jgi:hypothetical protein
MTISDANPSTVCLFVRFLYSGILVSTEESPLSTDQVLDLLILADRFETDSLKDLCQERLKSCISENSVLGLLYVADQYTAGNLRVRRTWGQGRDIQGLEYDPWVRLRGLWSG